MSEAPELPEAEALAAEHALGVLSGRERDEAETRMARDAVFAADVEAWRSRLAPLFDRVEPISPPGQLWNRIERQLPANDNGHAQERVKFWRRATGGSLGLAIAAMAAVAVLIGQGPQIVQVPAAAPPPGQLLEASLTTPTGKVQPLFVAAYDPDRHALIVTSLLPEGADRDKAHELWLIAGKDKPKSLGLIESGKAKIIPLPTEVMAKMSEGAALAVSIEPPGGSPSPDGPTGPIAAVGKLSKL